MLSRVMCNLFCLHLLPVSCQRPEGRFSTGLLSSRYKGKGICSHTQCNTCSQDAFYMVTAWYMQGFASTALPDLNGQAMPCLLS